MNGTQSAAHRSPGRPRTSARLTAVDDLPVAGTEIELGAPPTTLKLADGVTDARKIMALVRLHTHPLGMVVLDGTTNLRWSTHWAMVGSAMRDDLVAFFRVALNHRLVYQPAAVVRHRHHREMAVLRNQASGYGVGIGAFLTSVLVHEPRTWPALLRRLPAGISYAFSSSSDLNRGRYDGWPPELARLEMRGLIFGPGAYAVSRWRTRRTPIRQTPISDDREHGRRRSLR